MNDEGERKERDWEEACRREEAIRTLLVSEARRLSAKEVEKAALELGISRATLYRMIRLLSRYGNCFVVTSPSLGRPKKSRSLSPEREALIADAIRQFYLKLRSQVQQACTRGPT